MPGTATRVNPALAAYLLAHPDHELRRRLAILRTIPFPPGSRSLDADADWHALTARFPEHRAFLYGTPRRALVYTYDSRTDVLVVELAVVDGQLRP
jgi:hypothetical protein